MTDYLVFDIETYIDKMPSQEGMGYIKHNRVLKDPEKIKADRLKKMGFIPGVPRIVSIAYSVFCSHSMKYIEEPKGKVSVDEREILQWFATELRECEHMKLTGFNIKQFDYPHLCSRCVKHGVTLPIKADKWAFVDLMEFPHKSQGSLKEVCYWRGIKQDVMGALALKETETSLGLIRTGDDVARLWEEERLAELLAYNVEDVRMTTELLKQDLNFYKL